MADLFLQENTTERVKLFTLFSGEEDELLARYIFLYTSLTLSKASGVFTFCEVIKYEKVSYSEAKTLQRKPKKSVFY